MNCSLLFRTLEKHHRSENIPIEPYLNRLLLRGLVVKGDGLTGVDALYRLLGELYISPLQDSFQYGFLPASISA